MKKVEISREFLVREYIENNRSCEDIAQELGIALCTIARRIKKFNLSKPNKSFSKDILEQLYVVEKLSTEQIAQKLNCGSTHILNLLTKYNIPRRQYNYLYTKNDEFFAEPSYNNCYWAGFIAADGCIANPPTRQPYLVIGLQRQDECLLEAFKNRCEYTGPITQKEQNGQGKYINSISYSSFLSIRNCPKILKDLKDHFNIVSQKSLILKPPSLKDINLQLQFIIGLIDGDGHIGFNGKNMKFELIGTKSLLEWVSQILFTLEDAKYKPMTVYSKKLEKCFYINCSHQRAYKLLKKLEAIPTPYRLARKWDKIKEYEATL